MHKPFSTATTGALRDHEWAEHLQGDNTLVGDLLTTALQSMGPVGQLLAALDYTEVNTMKSFAELCRDAIAQKRVMTRLWCINGSLALIRTMPDHTYRVGANQPYAAYLGATRIFGDDAFVNRSAISLKFFLREALGINNYS